jgi:uncharacterized membrane protein YhhN
LIALTIGCAAACAVLVIAEWLGARNLRVGAKLLASAAFVAAGAVATAGEVVDPLRASYAHAIFAGLALGAIGDACLLGRGKRWFLAGLVAFLFGHLAYVLGIAMIAPAGRWPGDAGLIALVPVVAAAAVLASLWPHLGVLRGPVIA